MPEECRSCKGTGKLPPIEHEDGSVTPAAKCIQCDGAGNQYTIEELRAWAQGNADPNWKSTIGTGEPMDLAWRLLKDDEGHKGGLYGIGCDCAKCRAFREKGDEWGMDPDAKVTRCVECNAPASIYTWGEIQDDWICDDCLTEMGYES